MGGSKRNDEESLLEAIKFYQNGLIRYLERNDEFKMSHSLNKLSSYPIRVRHLKDTGVGRTVNLLSQKEGKVGEQARSLIAKWKLMVEQEEPKQMPEPSAEVPQKAPPQDSSNTYKPEDHKCSEKSYKNKYNSSEDENDMKLDSTGEDTRGSESSVSEEDKIYNSARKHSSSHNRDDKTSSKHRSGEKEHSSHNKYSSKHENHHSSKHDKEHSHSSRREKEHPSKYGKRGSSRSEIEKSSKKIKEDKDIDDYCRNEKQSSSNDENNRLKHDSSSRHDKHSSRHDDKHSSKHIDKHSSRHDDKYSSKHEKENSSTMKRTDRGEKDDSKRKEDKRHKEKDSLDDKSYKSDRKGSDKERSHKESDKDNVKEKDERQRKERDEKSKEYKNKIEEKSIKDEEKKSKSTKRNEEKSNTKYYPKEISSGCGTSFEEALGMMGIPSKEKKSHTKESTSKHKKSENHNSSKSPDNFENKKSKTESESDKKPKSSHRECEKKSEKKDKQSSSRLYTDEIPSTSGTSFEDALGIMEIPKRERKGIKRKSDNRENASNDSEICSSSGTTFEEALGMVEMPRKRKKLTDRSMDTSPVPVDLEPLPVPLPSSPLERMDVAPLNLPQITPNYKPLLRVLDNPTGHNESLFVDNFMKNKHHRTKIYSGNKNTLNKVPSLLDICINLLQDHIDDMEATGGVPYYILKPVLEKASPSQLLRLEYYNSYLTEDTDELWQLHCQKDFRNKQRQECESWREMYTRCLEEREARFLTLTASIKEAKKKSEPIRTTKIAYIDPPMVGSRRHRSTAVAVPTAKEKIAAIVRESKASCDVVVTHQQRASRGHAGPSVSSQSKPKKMAPLMAKSFSAFKNRRYKN